jgi:hypothetical protein
MAKLLKKQWHILQPIRQPFSLTVVIERYDDKQEKTTSGAALACAVSVELTMDW